MDGVYFRRRVIFLDFFPPRRVFLFLRFRPPIEVVYVPDGFETTGGAASFAAVSAAANFSFAASTSAFAAVTAASGSVVKIPDMEGKILGIILIRYFFQFRLG